MSKKIRKITVYFSIASLFLFLGVVRVFASWDITHFWDTGDINSRITSVTAIIDKDHDGTPYIIAPVQHGVRAYDKDGNLQWSYTGITNGYDVRGLAVGDLNGTGYNDSVVVVSGYYNTATDGKFAVLDKDGNVLQLFKGTDFSTSPSIVYAVAADGTDIYLGTNLGVTKFIKSGSTWSEDTSDWAKAIGAVMMIQVADTGNGKRVYVAQQSNGRLYSFETDGTQEWMSAQGSGYQSIFAIGKTDSSTSGLQIVVPIQSNLFVLDKDGNKLWSSGNTLGSNVRTSVALYDNDGDGQEEIYYSDMGQDVYVLKRNGSVYQQQYLLTDVVNSGQYGGLANYDINDDGDDEIFIYTTDGYLSIYDKTLSTQLKNINLGHGQAGGYYLGYQFRGNGIVFTDLSGDGHADMVITGGTGYIDVYEASGFGSLPTVTTQSASDVQQATATANGNITDTGGENNDRRGFVYDTSSHSLPGNLDPGSSDYAFYEEDTGSFGAGAFTIGLSGLSGGTTYYGRAYSHNSSGYTYGGEVSFTTGIIAVSIMSDGEVSYGIVPINTSKDTTSSGLNDTQIAKNTGTITADFNIKSSNAIGGTAWTISGVSSGSDQYMHAFSTDGGSIWVPMTASYTQLATSIAPDATKSFDLRITTPTISSDFSQKSITVTIQAVGQ